MLKLGGLREGKYHLEVFQDKNENLKYEEEDGKLFTDSLTIDSSTSIRVKPLPQMFKPLRYFHQRKGDTLQIESSRMIRPDSLLLKHCIGKNEDGTLFRIFPFRNKLILRNMDSLGTIFPDTIDRVETDSLRSLTEIPLKKKTRINRIGNKLEIAFTWNWKVLNHPKKIEYTKDSVWETVSSEKLDYGYLFQLPLLKAGKIKLRMDSLSFFNRRGMRKDSILINPADAEENGTIAGSIRSDEKNLVAELIDEEKQVVAKTGKGKFNWQIKPGRYKIQIFCDLNNDGIYTGGNIKQQRKAEPLFTYPGPVELKPGWDLENIEIKPDF